MGLYDHRDGSRLPVELIDGSGITTGVEGTATEAALCVGAVTIAGRPGDVPNPIYVDFYDNVTLAGYSFSSRRLRPGESFTVDLYWQARGPVIGEYTVFAHLLDGVYQTYGGRDAVPEPPAPHGPPGRSSPTGTPSRSPATRRLAAISLK